MKPSLQERLGYAATDRLLILHADDIGMCEATVSAWEELLEFGLLTSASAMAPCPWFPAVAAQARKLGERADLGLHLVLNCEWSDYRWGPVGNHEHSDGMTDARGYLHPLAAVVHQGANRDAIRRELQAQIARAASAGMDLTHFDSHMLALWHPDLMPIFLELAQEHGQPAFLVRNNARQIAQECVIPTDQASMIEAQIKAAEAAGHAAAIDSWHILPFGQHIELGSRLRWACDQFDTLGPGVHSLIGHPANDTPELRTIARDYPTRVADRQLLGSEELRKAIADRGFKLIGLREIRNLLRSV